MVEFRRKKEEKEDPEKCSVKGCDEPVKRSLSAKAVQKAMPDLQLKVKKPRKVRLCKEHYKDFKRATREDRKLERMGWER